MRKHSRERRCASGDCSAAGLLKEIPSDWGPKFENRGIATALTHTGPNSIRYQAPAHLAIVMLTPQPFREVAVSSDRLVRFLAPAGSVEIIPVATDIFASWGAPKKSLLTAIDPDVLSNLAGSEFDRVDYDLHPPPAGLVDEKAKMLAEMIGSEIAAKEANTLYLDSLHIVFSMHLLRKYSSIERPPALVHRGGLTANAWRNVNDYIRANLQSNLSISELAGIANLSQSHFLRAFRKTAGQSPHRYVLECRLSLAEQMIVTTTKSLSEIARQVGFSSHSHLATSMRRYRDVTPSELRRSLGIGIRSPLWQPDRVL